MPGTRQVQAGFWWRTNTIPDPIPYGLTNDTVTDALADDAISYGITNVSTKHTASDVQRRRVRMRYNVGSKLPKRLQLQRGCTVPPYGRLHACALQRQRDVDSGVRLQNMPV